MYSKNKQKRAKKRGKIQQNKAKNRQNEPQFYSEVRALKRQQVRG